MAKFTFIAGMAAGYVLGARAGKKRYRQIKRVSTKVWTSRPVERRKADLKIAAKTKAAPFVADRISDVAKAAGQALRESGSRTPQYIKTIPAVLVEHPLTGTDS
ncbi:MAG: protoporphyrinogen oxidase [Nostocoides sp.]